MGDPESQALPMRFVVWPSVMPQVGRVLLTPLTSHVKAVSGGLP